jgi:hypothetical protein
MVQRLGLAVSDLGQDTAGDSTALHARGKRDEQVVEAEVAAGGMGAAAYRETSRRGASSCHGGQFQEVTTILSSLHVHIIRSHKMSIYLPARIKSKRRLCSFGDKSPPSIDIQPM